MMVCMGCIVLEKLFIIISNRLQLDRSNAAARTEPPHQVGRHPVACVVERTGSDGADLPGDATRVSTEHLGRHSLAHRAEDD